MDRGYFLCCGMLGLAVALAVFFPLGAKRRVLIPRIVWWSFLIPGAVICMYGLSHSTAPSFATRITAVGRAYDHVELQRRGETFYGFRFVPEGGKPVNIETQIILPHWGVPAISDGQSFRIVYLEDNKRTLRNEAIDIAILSGENAGFHDSFDARPAGAWLGVPIGAALFGFGFFGLKYRKKDVISEASGSPETAQLSRLPSLLQ